MLNIALCDDEPNQLALIALYTSECMQSNQYECTIRQFLHPDELLRTCEKQRFHLYVLDIVMPLVNGIEVGKAIRKLDREAQIIYATTEPGFALQSFVANPINYLLKPIDKQQFFKTLTLAISKLDVQRESTFLVKTHEGMRILRLSEVVYCEYTSHTVIYTLVDAKIVTTCILKGTFAQHITPLLQDKRFLRPHTSYVLNMDYVESFGKNKFTLRNGYTVPIVAKQYSVVRDIYMDYLLAKESSR
ncbi:response regulator of the LytR/AlgR family [Sphaerochaeta pleomorpha str. Grapes]|uniref:Response regulator of the LytR/AlgR family n=1 Tax=Sphaerochaeta pleomorpha (strain ATCC BAA-1885 / DSM 22778 / Grapes) TaxID=158190 RepID=G8QT06_SPHPG|nr:LytTR family DNA-binding domain-containing protein [Sphaerochaeta pleomorpha]AEV27911.1 response regulator of the LytR/AlgR family [Sphaerochaeta pleomorpha str. Grapes]